MRAPLLLALVLLATAPAFAAEEPSGCDKFKWPIEHERAALTAPDRIKLASGGGLAAPAAAGSHQACRGRRPRPPAVDRNDAGLAGARGGKAADAAGTRAEGKDLCRLC